MYIILFVNQGTREIVIKVFQRQEEILQRLKESSRDAIATVQSQTIVIPPGVKVCFMGPAVTSH